MCVCVCVFWPPSVFTTHIYGGFFYLLAVAAAKRESKSSKVVLQNRRVYVCVCVCVAMVFLDRPRGCFLRCV